MSDKILIRINTFGPLLSKEDVEKIFNKKLTSNERIFTVNILENFFEMSLSEIKREYLKRYVEITTDSTHLSITPADNEIILRIIKPLVLAKKYYCLGEYLSCIAMSGLVGEMVALLIWKISEISIRGNKISQIEETGLFSYDFEGLGQKRRISILETVGALKGDDKKIFSEVKNIRNKYLHLWQYDSRQQKGDAKKCICDALILFKRVTNIGIAVKDGKQSISVNPLLLKFLNSQMKATKNDQ